MTEQSTEQSTDQTDETTGQGERTPSAAMSDKFTAKPPEDEIQEIEAERERRLDPDNRPDGTEVDNTHRDFDSEAGMFTDAPGYEDIDPGDKPYDDDAGEMKAPDRSGGTESSEESSEPTEPTE